jgi:hypothetical protein
MSLENEGLILPATIGEQASDKTCFGSATPCAFPFKITVRIFLLGDHLVFVLRLPLWRHLGVIWSDSCVSCRLHDFRWYVNNIEYEGQFDQRTSLTGKYFGSCT